MADPGLKAAVDAASNILRRSRPGPDGVAAAAAALDGVRRAVADVPAVTFRPRVVNEGIPGLLSTGRQGQGGAAAAAAAAAAGAAGSMGGGGGQRGGRGRGRG